MKELLETRNKMKAKKPTFLKQDANRLSRLKKQWRQPKGQHSKMRKKLRSYRKQPSMGYSSPKEVRGLTREGHQQIIINRTEELEKITTPVSIGSTVGKRKRLEIIKTCKEKNIEILNIKDIDDYVNKIEVVMKKKKEVLSKRKEKREKEEKKKQEKREKEEKKKETEPVSEETKKKEQEDKRKILEKRE